MKPSSFDSRVTTALSVSTSQSASPTSIWSPKKTGWYHHQIVDNILPSLTSHCTIEPSSIVGDKAGIGKVVGTVENSFDCLKLLNILMQIKITFSLNRYIFVCTHHNKQIEEKIFFAERSASN